MNLRKAVITAAGIHQRALPLQTFVDRDGVEKTALQIIIEEAISAGAEEVCLIIAPGDRDPYRQAAGRHASRLHFVEQISPRGYGHALSLAREFTGAESFLHLISDHLYISKTAMRCAHQVVERARVENCAVSAVQATREHMLPFYGTVGARRVARQTDLYEIENVLEKPTPSEAEQKLIVPGLRAGYYLCFFGIHVLTPAVMTMLQESLEPPSPFPLPPGGEGRVRGAPPQGASLTSVLARLCTQERYLALEVQGIRHNLDVKYGLLLAQLALALDGADRENVLASLVELLATLARSGETKR
jgi:UTP--glucose-1-phosphate uridylyltransferase